VLFGNVKYKLIVSSSILLQKVFYGYFVSKTSENYIIVVLKELEHRKLGWKVLILKYDLGKGLSKEM